MAISDQEIDTGNSAVFQANGTGAAYADKILAAVRTLAPGEKAVLSWVAKTGSAGTIEKSIRVILLNQAGTQRARIDLLKAANGLVHIAPLMLSSSWYCGQQIAVGADTVKMKIEMDTSSTKFYYYNNGWQLIYSLNIPMDSLYSLEIWGNYDGWIDSMKLEVW